MNCELPDVQARFRKGRGTRDQIANIHWIIETAREFQKNIYFCFLDYAKAFAWITINCGKFWKRWEYQTTWPASWEYVKALYCHPAYLTYMQSTSWETLGWKKHKLESRL